MEGSCVQTPTINALRFGNGSFALHRHRVVTGTSEELVAAFPPEAFTRYGFRVVQVPANLVRAVHVSEINEPAHDPVCSCCVVAGEIPHWLVEQD